MLTNFFFCIRKFPGSQFDEYGNVRQWWSEKTFNEFNNRASCFVDQYSDIREPITGDYVTKQKVNFNS